MGINDSQGTLSNPVELTASRALWSKGAAPWDGTAAGKFAGSTGGTVDGANVPSGFTGNFADWQVAGVSKFQVDSKGNVKATSAVAGAGVVIVPVYEYIQDVQNQVAAASYAVSHGIFVAPNTSETWQLVAVTVTFTTTSTSGTLQVEVATGTQAPAAGTNQLSAAMSLSGTANTPVNGTLIAAPTTIAAGNRVNLVFAGTVTGLLGAVITVVLQRLS